jgi:hypothetical protein
MKTTFPFLLFTTALAAQAMPLPDGSGRVVQVFDVAKLLPTAKPGPDLALKIADEHAFPASDPLAAIAACLGRLLEPKLGPDDDLKTLGDRRLVLLGTAAQAKGIERLLQAATSQHDRLIDVHLQFFTVADKDFQEQLGKRLPAVQRGARTTREAVFDKNAADELLALLAKLPGDRLEAPPVTVRPLALATLFTKNQTAYVKDFTITRQGENWIADPVVATVWDGNESEVIATLLPADSLGVSCSVTFQELEKPIARFETKIGPAKVPATLQLPSLTVLRMQLTATLQDGGAVALATQKTNGSWLVATASATAQPR